MCYKFNHRPTVCSTFPVILPWLRTLTLLCAFCATNKSVLILGRLTLGAIVPHASDIFLRMDIPRFCEEEGLPPTYCGWTFRWREGLISTGKFPNSNNLINVSSMFIFFFADVSINLQLAFSSISPMASAWSMVRDLSLSHLLPTSTIGMCVVVFSMPLTHWLLHSLICWQRRPTSSKDSLLSMLYTNTNRSPTNEYARHKYMYVVYVLVYNLYTFFESLNWEFGEE